MSSILELMESMPMMAKVESDYLFNGNKVPRVTKIISRCIHSDGLMYWANSLGFKHLSYRKTLNEAANIGSQCHENIDQFLENHNHKEDAINMMREARTAYLSFRKWYGDIELYAESVEVLMHEQTLTCKYYGGTLDGLYRINGKIYIVDYKTSNHITFNYLLQIAAYILMLEEQGYHIDGCIILQLSKTEVSYKEHILDFSNPAEGAYMEECKQAFLAMLYWYYNLCNIEDRYKDLGWK